MKELNTEFGKLQLEKRSHEFLVTPAFSIGRYGIRRLEKVHLPNMSYGEFLFFYKTLPKYYIALSGTSQSSLNLKKQLQKSDLIAQDEFLKLLKKNGKRHANLFQGNWCSIRCGKAYIKSYDVYVLK